MAETEHDFLLRVLKGNAAAVDFCEAVFRISQIADDLFDGDKPVAPEIIEEVFWRCLVQLPKQPFYTANFQALQPLIENAFICWMTANQLERGNEHDKSISFVLRDEVGAIAVHVAYLVGGYYWGKKVAPEIRRFIHDEPLAAYTGELQR